MEKIPLSCSTQAARSRLLDHAKTRRLNASLAHFPQPQSGRDQEWKRHAPDGTGDDICPTPGNIEGMTVEFPKTAAEVRQASGTESGEAMNAAVREHDRRHGLAQEPDASVRRFDPCGRHKVCSGAAGHGREKGDRDGAEIAAR